MLIIASSSGCSVVISKGMMMTLREEALVSPGALVGEGLPGGISKFPLSPSSFGGGGGRSRGGGDRGGWLVVLLGVPGEFPLPWGSVALGEEARTCASSLRPIEQWPCRPHMKYLLPSWGSGITVSPSLYVRIGSVASHIW